MQKFQFKQILISSGGKVSRETVEGENDQSIDNPINPPVLLVNYLSKAGQDGWHPVQIFPTSQMERFNMVLERNTGEK